MKRRAARVDANQTAIVKAFRKLGFSVSITSALGNGFPDIAIAKNYRTRLVEIKDGDKPPSARQLTADELTFANNWRDIIIICESLDDVNFIAENWGDL